MPPPQLMAVVPVFDVDIASEFYERLLARPADNHPDSRMVWILNENSYIQVSFDPLRAGSTRWGIFAWVLGLDRYSMDDVAAELRKRGVETRVNEDAAGNKDCDIRDPDGNRINIHVEPAPRSVERDGRQNAR
jgi:catechol 2,3-dioxygenase-like lactoylglutathione lyase family enzyme